MNINPCGDRILVKVDVVEEKTEGGIYLADTYKDKYQAVETHGVVERVGKNAWEEYPEPWAKVGDRVIFRKSAGVAHKDGDDHYRVMMDEDILAVIDD